MRVSGTLSHRWARSVSTNKMAQSLTPTPCTARWCSIGRQCEIHSPMHGASHRRRAVLCIPQAFAQWRSEEHTSELQSLMRISYAFFCLKKKNTSLTRQKTIYDEHL